MGTFGHNPIALAMNADAHLCPGLEHDAARALDNVLTLGS
jgi:hypothetical protein